MTGNKLNDWKRTHGMVKNKKHQQNGRGVEYPEGVLTPEGNIKNVRETRRGNGIF